MRRSDLSGPEGSKHSRGAGKLYRSEHQNPAERAERMREWMAQGTWVFEHDAEKAAEEALSTVGH